MMGWLPLAFLSCGFCAAALGMAYSTWRHRRLFGRDSFVVGFGLSAVCLGVGVLLGYGATQV